jgi:hypothetical protein
MSLIKIYQVRLGSLGEYVFCASSLDHLYECILNSEQKYEILYTKDDTFMTLEEFKRNWENNIREVPLQYGYLGGYSE